MEFKRFVAPLALVFVLALVLAPSEAMAAGGKKGHGMYGKHHETMMEMMDMVKETMEIVQGLNHTPSGADKKKLGKMVERMDEIIKENRAMHKMYMKGGKNPCGMNPCGMNPCGMKGGMNPCDMNPCGMKHGR